MKNEYRFVCDSAVVLIQSDDEDNAWEMLEELIDSDRVDEFILDDRGFKKMTRLDER